MSASTTTSTSAAYHPPSQDGDDAHSGGRRQARNGMLALVDQAFVSGARFATSILIGRYSSPDELGVYSLGFSLLVLVTCVQESLITSPYTVFQAQRQGEAWRIYNGSVLLHFIGLSLLSVVGFGIAWGIAGSGGLATVLGVLAISTPFALLREFARRTEFARLRLPVATLIDGTVAVLQVGLLGWLAWQGTLTAGRAFIVIGIASGLTACGWLWITREHYQTNRTQSWEDLRGGWRLGKWIFMAQMTGLLHLQGMYWLIASLMGPTQTGLFAACSTLVLFINPFALGVNNYIGPMAVHTARDGGLSAVRRLIGWSMLAMFLIVFAFSAALFWACDPIMSLLFQQSEYLGHRWLVFLLGLNIALNTVHMINDGGLWAVERPQVIFWSTLVAVIVTFGSAAWMVPNWGLIGAAMSLLIGRLLAATIEAGVFFAGLTDLEDGPPRTEVADA